MPKKKLKELLLMQINFFTLRQTNKSISIVLIGAILPTKHNAFFTGINNIFLLFIPVGFCPILHTHNSTIYTSAYSTIKLLQS